MREKECPYSNSIKKGNLGYVSGQLGVTSKGELIGESDVKLQTSQALKNLFAAVEDIGGTIADIAFVNVYLQDIERDFNDMNEVYQECFQGEKPCRVTVGAKLVETKYLVEISAMVILS